MTKSSGCLSKSKAKARLANSLCLFLVLAVVLSVGPKANLQAQEKVRVWPGKAPGETRENVTEYDRTKDSDNLIAGRRLIRLTDVTTPELEIFRPDPSIDTGASVVICPGGGHYVLAYDLEGTEVAEWLNTIGVTGIVLKYRVPSQTPDRRWLGAVQDAQRSVSLVRSKAEEWKLDPERIGILGFSAGGETAGLTSLMSQSRKYEAIDDVDSVSCRPNFSILVYTAGFTNKDKTGLPEYITVDSSAPPTFFAHANDDGVSSLNPLFLATALRKADVPVEVHLYSKGGHGFGLRRTEQACTHWPDACHLWLKELGFLTKAAESGK